MNPLTYLFPALAITFVVLFFILGLIGGVVGSVVLGFIGIEGRGLIGGTIVSVVGACILIWISRKF